jgi:uncharacterized RDD family membrane protein YckC
MTQSGQFGPENTQGEQPPPPGQWQSAPQQGMPPTPAPGQPYQPPPSQGYQWSGPAETASPPGPPIGAPPQAPYGAALTSEGYGVRLSFALPPGTELASVGRRIGGYFMELLLAIITLGIGYIIWALIVWARGQTPGKQVLGMYCYRPGTGLTASWGYMLLRWFGQVLESVIPFGFIITSIMMIVSDEHKAIHDHIAGTVVLHRTS